MHRLWESYWGCVPLKQKTKIKKTKLSDYGKEDKGNAQNDAQRNVRWPLYLRPTKQDRAEHQSRTNKRKHHSMRRWKPLHQSERHFLAESSHLLKCVERKAVRKNEEELGRKASSWCATCRRCERRLAELLRHFHPSFDMSKQGVR